VNADLSTGPPLHDVAFATDGLLRVEMVFHLASESQGQVVAAKLIDRVHELANSPECECDVDVSVEWVGPEAPAGPGEALAGVVPPASGRTAER
jgi:hypothetical protein